MKQTVAEVQEAVLANLASGMNVADACKAAGRSRESYKKWRQDAAFAERADRAIRRAKGIEEADPIPDFETFCRDCLHQPLYAHQLRWFDVLEGREPRDMHPSMMYQPGVPSRLLITTPPNHAKSTTITQNYVTWRIAKDPNIRVIIISKSQVMAKKMLLAIKHRLTSSMYTWHQQYGPVGGYKSDEGSWTATEIYVGARESAEKDPTVQALGIGNQVYGARADLIILDDAVTIANANLWESQLEWLNREVVSRLPARGGKLIVVGTRVAPVDLYAKLREAHQWNGDPLYTFFSQPAILDSDGDPPNWRTLWPYLDDPEEGRVQHFDGPTLSHIKAEMGARQFALVYQQEQVSEDAVFPGEAVRAAVNGQRTPGLMTHEGVGHRKRGMDGLYVIGGLDPATVGHTAMVVYAVDRETRKRYLLDGFDQPNTTPHVMRAKIKELTTKYGIRVWRVERNAFQRFLTQDEEIRQFLYNKGCLLREHYTHGNKWDEGFGVASLAPLFLSCLTPDGQRAEEKNRLIDLPNPRLSRITEQLIEQLLVWSPDMAQRQLTDLVMALWFAEIEAREYLASLELQTTHLRSGYRSRSERGGQQVVDLERLYDEMMADSA